MTEIYRIGIYSLLSLAVILVALTGCSTVSNDGPGDAAQLEEAAHRFHSNMRWGRFDFARDSVHTAYRGTFDGMYEEYGEDYDIVEIRLKRADLLEEGFAAFVEVEQQWFQLPSTMVQKERFVERWVFENGQWWMRERMLRSDYRDQDERFDSEPDDNGDDEGLDEGDGPEESA